LNFQMNKCAKNDVKKNYINVIILIILYSYSFHFITAASSSNRIDIAGSISPLKLSYEVGSDSTADGSTAINRVSSSEIEVLPPPPPTTITTITPTETPPPSSSSSSAAAVKSGGGGGASTAVPQVLSISDSGATATTSPTTAAKERALSRELIKKQAIINLTSALETVNNRQLISIFDAVSLKIYRSSIY
jgi:hypothetical protein